MNILNEQFNRAAKEKRVAFMPFLVAGFPNFRLGLEVAKELAKDSDLLEIGFPYSDPLADGPAIQNADQIALKNGFTTGQGFEFIKKVRKFTKIPITILVYANVVYQRGLNRFYLEAQKSGVNAILVPDVPVEEIEPFAQAAKKAGVEPIFLVTQTTGKERLKKILKYAQGYLYVVSVLGVTGARKNFGQETNALIRRIKAQTTLPLAIGFGISNRSQISKLKKAGADGVIVGSAFVKIIEKYQTSKNLLSKLREYKNSLI